MQIRAVLVAVDIAHKHAADFDCRHALAVAADVIENRTANHGLIKRQAGSDDMGQGAHRPFARHDIGGVWAGGLSLSAVCHVVDRYVQSNPASDEPMSGPSTFAASPLSSSPIDLPDPRTVRISNGGMPIAAAVRSRNGSPPRTRSNVTTCRRTLLPSTF